jgi:hypothetical protein
MEDRLSFGKIHIIEWIKQADGKTGEPAERRTGEETHRYLRTLIPATGARVEAILHRVSSRAGFLMRLQRIEADFRVSGTRFSTSIPSQRILSSVTHSGLKALRSICHTCHETSEHMSGRGAPEPNRAQATADRF